MYDYLLAGWASTDITPCKRVSLQGQNYERISEGVHDPIYATALALQKGNVQVIMVACDLIVIRRPLLLKVRELVATKQIEISPESILINSIHTHTAPYYSDCDMKPEFDECNWHEWEKVPENDFCSPTAYFDFLAEKLADAVCSAWLLRKPAKIGTALGHVAIGYCRRVLYKNGGAAMYGRTDTDGFDKIEAGCDHGVELMYFFNAEDNLTGVIVNVACPSQVVELKKLISADYIGAARRKIKERLGKNVFVLPQISAAGDQSPRDLIRRKNESAMFEFEGVEELGDRLADAVCREYKCLRNIQKSPVLKHTVKNIDLPIRRVSEAEIEWATKRREEINGESDPPLFDILNSESILERAKMQETVSAFDMEMHVIRLGDAVFASNSFELFIEYGQRIKARSKANQTFLIQLCGADGVYLPTESAIKVGSYGAAVFSGTVGYEGGNMLVEETVTEINSLWE